MEFKTCPYCAEEIKAAAIVCKHCGKELLEFEEFKSSKPSRKLTRRAARKLNNLSSNTLRRGVRRNQEGMSVGHFLSLRGYASRLEMLMVFLALPFLFLFWHQCFRK